MQQTKIEWVRNRDGSQGQTWNPFTGCRSHCPYCYARRMAKRQKDDFTPKIHPKRLHEPEKLRTPNRIFVGSMGDVAYTDKGFLSDVLSVCRACPRHKFFFLTKSPELLGCIQFPDNCWVGVTITDLAAADRFNAHAFAGIRADAGRFISFEPLHEYEHLAMSGVIAQANWIIVGSETNNRGRIVESRAPKSWWVEDIVSQCQINSRLIFLKDNLQSVWGSEFIQEIP